MNIEGLHAKCKVGTTHGFAGASGLAFKLGMTMEVDPLDPFFLILEAAAPEFTRVVRDIVAARASGQQAVQTGTFQAKFESARLGGKLRHAFTIWGLPEDARTGEPPLLEAPTGAFGKHVVVEASPTKNEDEQPEITVKFDLIVSAALLKGFDGPSAASLDGSDVFLDCAEQEPDINERPNTTAPTRRTRVEDDAADEDGDDEGEDAGDDAPEVEAAEAPVGGLDGWAAAVAKSRAMADYDAPRSAESYLGLEEGALAGPAALKEHLSLMDVKGDGGLRALHVALYGKQTRAPKDFLVNYLAAALRPRLSSGAPDGWPASMPWRRWTAGAVDDHLKGLAEADQRTVYGELTSPEAAARAPRGQLTVSLIAAFASRFGQHFIAE